MKLALALGVGALGLISVVHAEAKPGFAATTVNMRSGPGTANEIVAKIPGGAQVEINTCTNGWCEVSWGGKSGFAIETALSDRAPVVRRTYPGYAGPPAYGPPPVYYGPPAYYYGPGPYYYGYGPYRRRRYWW